MDETNRRPWVAAPRRSALLIVFGGGAIVAGVLLGTFGSVAANPSLAGIVLALVGLVLVLAATVPDLRR